MCSKSFDNEVDSIFNNRILDSINKPEDVVSLSLSIKASHAGKINSNNIFYTPRSMEEGSTTLVQPFSKHIQRLHRGNAVGVISKSEYLDYTDKYSDNVKELSKRISEATTSKELVDAVKELVSLPEYKQKDYLGLGVLQVNAELHDKTLIKELTTGKNKGKVSIGGDSYSVFCSICGGMYDDNHIHQRGEMYNGEKCFAIYDNMLLDHIGFVPDPADSNTETSIIQDSIIDRSNTVTINSYKIQDNKQGKSMTLTVDKLKEISKTSEGLLSLDVYKQVDPAVLEACKAKFESELANGRKSSYLFSEEKTLPLKSKETVALAKLAIDSLDEEDPEKKALQALVQTPFERHFKENENVEEYLKEYKVEKPKETEKQPEVSKESAVSFDDKTLDTLSTIVADKILEGMKPKTQAVEDSVSFKQLTANNKQLSSEIEELIEANSSLEKQHKNLLVDRIISLQGLESDEEYKEKLLSRDLSSLQHSLSDLEYKNNKEKQTPKEDVKTAEQLEAEKAQQEKEKAEAEKKAKEQEEDSKALAKKTISDSISGKEEPKTHQEKELSASDYIKQHGYSAYIKRTKKGLN